MWTANKLLPTSLTVVNRSGAPEDVERIIRAARTDITFSAPSPDRKWFLRTPASDRGTIADYGKPHLFLGQEAGGQDRQGRVLVASSGDLPRQGLAAVDNEFVRHDRG